MSITRFFSTSDVSVGALIPLEAESAKHCKVLRLKDKAPVGLLNGKGQMALGVLEGMAVRVLEIKTQPQPTVKIQLAVGVTQGGTFEDIVRQAVEMGAQKIIPLKSERGAVGIDEKRAESKHDRWCKITQEACKQCGQLWLPEVASITTFKEALKQNAESLNLVAALEGECTPWSELKLEAAPTVTVWVGPEGDFSSAEYAALRAAGAKGVSLGNLVLRVETAAVAALARVETWIKKS